VRDDGERQSVERLLLIAKSWLANCKLLY